MRASGRAKSWVGYLAAETGRVRAPVALIRAVR